MKRIVLSVGALFMLVFCLTACNSQEPKSDIANELGIDVSSGSEASNLDSHGGFHGDGTTYIVLNFPDNKILEQIKESTQWKSFPLDETARALVYGISDEESSVGPFLSDESGNPLVPEIQNGYYLLIDRHSDKETDILKRASFNFTLGLYDTDTDTLYYCKLDT